MLYFACVAPGHQVHPFKAYHTLSGWNEYLQVTRRGSSRPLRYKVARRATTWRVRDRALRVGLPLLLPAGSHDRLRACCSSSRPCAPRPAGTGDRALPYTCQVLTTQMQSAYQASSARCVADG